MKLLAAFQLDGTIDASSIDAAARLLAQGRLVAIPTETVYGLAAHALDEAAVRRIFEAKARPSFNPLIVHVAGIDAARRLSSAWPETAERLARAFWPGPLTLVVPKIAAIPDVVTGGLDSVALRAPAHPAAHALLERSQLPLAAPSANPFGSVSPTTAAHVITGLACRIDAVLDGGACAVGIESTVVDLTGARPRLLRPGGVSKADLERVVGPVEERHEVLDEGARVSPGLLSRHYAPKGQAVLVAAEALETGLAAIPDRAARIGAIVRDHHRPNDPRIARWERLGGDPVTFAQGLYAALHALDAAGCTHVLLERVPDQPEWRAVLDRLTRAAGSPETP